MAFAFFIPALSVRARIAALALIPVVGFGANALTYMSSEQEVAAAFEVVHQAGALTEASQNFKAALSAMRGAATEFANRPTEQLNTQFTANHQSAVYNLDVVESILGSASAEEFGVPRRKLDELLERFTFLVREQQRLGATDGDGIRGRLRRAGAAVERILNADLPGITKTDRSDLAVSLLDMRRHETEYRLERTELAKLLFSQAYERFNGILAAITAPDGVKEELNREVKAYVGVFNDWIASTGDLRPALAVINMDTQELLPAADAIIASARERAAAARAALQKSQALTRHIIIAVGFAVVGLGLLLSWLIGRGITRPLTGLARAMQRLADGDTSVAIPAVADRDEIGRMARSVIVFRDNAIERERLRSIQDENARMRERRGQIIAETIRSFESSVAQALGNLRGASQRLETTATALNSAADAVSLEARSAEERAGAASENVTSAAGSAEELAGSIGEIANQAEKSRRVAGHAVAEVKRTVATMSDLGAAASRIGEVVGLIQAIAGQTNLLALNATIEAARAGEAGRGFAVVAAEVKSLAAQTARATDDIAAQIHAIQTAAQDAGQAIEQVSSIIQDMSGIAASVAASVEQQNAAVAMIAEGVNLASNDARSGAEAMSRVAERSQDARATAAGVKALAEVLASEAEGLDAEVRRFLEAVQAA
ncbi:MAG TPA: HAMP domain-containing methyl-accepting chemotaxis protein [Xanthobacteraceae bacterium]|nr:HAMP domain-containing methyl-accepting chemotaxis protein [Xanthobacteraceae bacterium]